MVVDLSVARLIIDARTRAKLTQVALAEIMGTSQSAITRLERGATPNLSTLRRLAEATGNELRISFEPRASQTSAEPRMEEPCSGGRT
jgi:transcriptional regulator with XRE-family HTH domain